MSSYLFKAILTEQYKKKLVELRMTFIYMYCIYTIHPDMLSSWIFSLIPLNLSNVSR